MYCLVSASAEPLAKVPRGTPQPPVNCGSAVTLNPPPNLVESELRAASLLRPNCCSSPATLRLTTQNNPDFNPIYPVPKNLPIANCSTFGPQRCCILSFFLFSPLLLLPLCLVFGLDAIAASHPLGSFPGRPLFCAFERGLDTPPSEDAN
ncbi:hypothetical protein GGI35DRAFT_272043 [Trichoderma velutinum]